MRSLRVCASASNNHKLIRAGPSLILNHALDVAHEVIRRRQRVFRELLKIASHVGWVKPRKRRTQQNHIVRRYSVDSLRLIHPTFFEFLEAPFNFRAVRIHTFPPVLGSWVGLIV